MEFDIEIDNKEGSKFASGKTHLYFLHKKD